MDNLDVARSLAQAGYGVFPCQPAGDDRKRPQPGVMWRSASTSDVPAIERLWSRHPGSAPGIDVGKSPFLVVDCDRGKGSAADGHDWFRAACDQNDYPIEKVPIVVTPSGGWHCYFRQPLGPRLGNGRGSLPPKSEVAIDIRGAGGYVIAPGAAMDVGEYRYLDPGCTIEDAPELPAWLASILRGEGPAATKAAEPSRPATAAVDRDDRRVSAYLDKAVEAECALVRSAPKGGRNNQLNQSALKLGHYVGGGHIAESTVIGALTAAASEAGLNPVETAKTIRSGLEAGKRTPKDPPEREDDGAAAAELVRQFVAAHDGTLHDAETGEVFDPAPGGAREIAPHLLRPPGLVGELVDWIDATSRHPSSALALGAALTIVGTAAGRQFAGPTRSGTHLYVLGLAPTGTGKDHPRQCIYRVMKASGLSHHLGPDDFSSATALIKHVQNRPLSVCPMDEFGSFLAKINAKKASTHERMMSAFLRKAWGASFGIVTTPAYAQMQSEEIEAPALSIYGTSTPEEFFRSLEASDVDNGVLNRFLLIATTEKPAERDPGHDPADVPPAITEGLRVIAMASGEFWAASANATKLSRIERPMQFTPDAKAIYQAMGAHVRGEVERDGSLQAFYARTVEMAIRVASIVAVGRSPDAWVTADDMTYGRDLAMWSAETMMAMGSDHMAASENQALAKRIIRLLRASKGRILKRDLWRRLDHVARWQDVDNALKALQESGQVERGQVKTGGKGRPTEEYVLVY